MTLAYPGWNGYVGYEQPGYPITYLSDDHVQCTGDTTIYIPGGTGITLQTGYDTYYRISGYDVTGGTVENGVLIPTGPCTIKAVEMVNYFTATGNFEKGSNISVTGTSTTNWTTKSIGAKYALHQNHTGDIPSSWYNTSNGWKVNDASAYSITFNTKLTYTANYKAAGTIINTATAYGLIGSTSTGSVTTNFPSKTWNYNKTFTTTTQNVNYGLNGTVGAKRYGNSKGITTYVANNTNGTWTATGIAP
jgi:hypothetical protein